MIYLLFSCSSLSSPLYDFLPIYLFLCVCLSVYMVICFSVFMFLCFSVSLFLCFSVSLFHFFSFSLFLFFSFSMFLCSIGLHFFSINRCFMKSLILLLLYLTHPFIEVISPNTCSTHSSFFAQQTLTTQILFHRYIRNKINCHSWYNVQIDYWDTL